MASGGQELPRVTSKLDIDNYMAWSHEIEYLLRFHDLWGLVVPTNHPEAEPQITSSAGRPAMGMQLRSGATLGASKTEPPHVDTDGRAAAGSGSGVAADKMLTVPADPATAALAWDETVNEQRQRGERARVIIMLNVRAHHSAKLRRHRTGRALWAALREEFHPKRTSRANALRRQLNMLKMGPNETPVRYFNRAWDLVALLQELDITVDEDWLLGALLGGIPSKYEHTLSSMEERDDITVRKALAMLRAADVRAKRFQEQDKAEKEAATALAAAGDDDRRPRRDRYRNTRCHKCDQLGHIQRHCRARSGAPKQTAVVPPAEDDEAGTAGLARLALESDEDEDEYEVGYAMLAYQVADTDTATGGAALLAHKVGDDAGARGAGDTWAVDSGASHHMCGTAARLRDVHQGRPVTITLADGTTTRATTRGTAVLRVDGTKITLRDVLLVPGMTMPLFSVRTASRAGYTTEFSEAGVRILHEGSTILRGTTAGGIYVLHTQGRGGGDGGKALAASAAAPDPVAPPTDAEEPIGPEEAPSSPSVEEATPRMIGADGAPSVLHHEAGGTSGTATEVRTGGVDPKAALWHRRYGHLSVDGLMRTLDAVNGMDLTRSALATLKGAPCEPCIMGKMVRAPYVASDREPERVLVLVHSDVIGPMSVPTPKGRRYMMGAVDDYSRYKVIVPIAEKGHAKDALMRVLNLWENVTGERVLTIRTDDGKEYCGPTFDKWVSDKGIRHETSAPYAHQHNGVAERFNRTVQEHMLAVLTEARLDHKYWGEAATAVTRALNRTPQRGQTTTPYELFYGRRPDVSTLRVFGCRAWAYLPPEVRRKLDPRALPATHLGYAEESKGYRVLINGRVYIRRDVTFDETARGNGEPWNAPPGEVPATEAGAPASGVASPIEDAIAAARRLVGATAPPGEDAGNETGGDTSDTDVPSITAGDNGGDMPATAPPSEPTAQTEARAQDGDGTGASRRSLRLHERQQRAQAAEDGGKGLRAWALTAGGRGGPDKMRVYEARKEADWPAFDAANRVEVQALWDNGTWEMMPLPSGKKVTQTELLCERKRGANGEIVKYKGRLVVRGDTQIPLIDYTATWAPVARYTTLRMLLAHCTSHDLALLQLDVATAFLNGEVEEELYIREPRGYERGAPGLVCRLRKALYGLKQAARAWYRKLRETLERAGFEACEADECLFKRVGPGGDVCFILVYVDDLLVAAPTMDAAQAGRAVVTTAFKSKTMGEPAYFLGLHIEHDAGARTTRVHQRQYISSLLTRFGLEEANPVQLPMGAGAHLSKVGRFLDADLTKLYQELVGSLLYLSTSTRPDIAFAVGRLTRFVAAPTEEHLAAGKVVLRYLKGSAELGLCFSGAGELTGFCDADFAADRDNRRSTSAMVFLYGGAAVAWGSKLQPSVAASTTEAEYIAAAGAAKESMWLRRLRAFVTEETGSVALWCDSQSALALMHNPVTSARTKHIDVCHHLVRERVADGTLVVQYVGTAEQTADILTKPLGTIAFARGVRGLGMRGPPQGVPRGGVLELSEPGVGGLITTAPPPGAVPTGTGVPTGAAPTDNQ